MYCKKELRFKIHDASGPQRIEVLESSLGEMKVELSFTRTHIEQMMGIMQQLLHAKSTDGGQQEEKSGGTGRGDANNDIGGVGRAVSNHSSRVLDGPKPDDDTDQRPEIPSGVCYDQHAVRRNKRFICHGNSRTRQWWCFHFWFPETNPCLKKHQNAPRPSELFHLCGLEKKEYAKILNTSSD